MVLVGGVRVGRDEVVRRLRLEHPPLGELVREDLEAERGIPESEETEHGRPPDVRVAADMIRVAAGVDDQADHRFRKRMRGLPGAGKRRRGIGWVQRPQRLHDLAHRGEHPVARGRGARIDHDDAVAAGRYRDVSARARNHVDIACDVQRLDLVIDGRPSRPGIGAFGDARRFVAVDRFQRRLCGRRRQRRGLRPPRRIERVHTSSHAVERRLVLEGRLGQVGILSRKVVRHAVAVARLVLFRLAGIWGYLERGGSHVRGAPNQRLRQVIGIDDRERPLEVRFFE